MAIEVVYHPDVKNRDLPKIDARSKEMIKRVIEKRLSTHPEVFGRPLRGSLKGYWKLRVGGYRIVFKPLGEKILVLAIVDRKTVYQKSERRVEKP
jgi:mRNA interferase RelE/StbE